jgi:AcrR family transcriptional regulator
MAIVTNRKYQQRLRAEAAEETRRRVLDAVYQRLSEAPSEPVSIDSVAKMAGVARSTVYLIFGSRTGLFGALGADLLERGGFERILSAIANPDPRASLREGMRGVVEMHAANRNLLRALHSMAQLDAEAVGGVVHRMEESRSTGMADLARRLAACGALRPGIEPAAAADLLWVLTSFDCFDLLYTGRSRPVPDIVATLTLAAESALFAEPPDPPGRG